MEKFTGNTWTLYWGKFCNKNNTLKRAIGMPVNWHISTGILTKIARYPRQNVCLNVSIYWHLNDTLQSVIAVAEFFLVNEQPVGSCHNCDQASPEFRHHGFPLKPLEHHGTVTSSIACFLWPIVTSNELWGTSTRREIFYESCRIKLNQDFNYYYFIYYYFSQYFFYN